MKRKKVLEKGLTGVGEMVTSRRDGTQREREGGGAGVCYVDVCEIS